MTPVLWIQSKAVLFALCSPKEPAVSKPPGFPLTERLCVRHNAAAGWPCTAPASSPPPGGRPALPPTSGSPWPGRRAARRRLLRGQPATGPVSPWGVSCSSGVVPRSSCWTRWAWAAGLEAEPDSLGVAETQRRSQGAKTHPEVYLYREEARKLVLTAKQSWWFILQMTSSRAGRLMAWFTVMCCKKTVWGGLFSTDLFNIVGNALPPHDTCVHIAYHYRDPGLNWGLFKWLLVRSVLISL